MIPYVEASTFHVGPFEIDTAAALTALGLVGAIYVAHRRALRLGVDAKRLDSFAIWVLVGALCGGHLAASLLYHPREVAEVIDGHLFWNDPWELLRIWRGWRSIGGVFGAIFAGLMWRRYVLRSTVWFRLAEDFVVEGLWFVRRPEAERVLSLADVIAAAFPVFWLFNRAGITLSHEYPGTRAPADFVFAIAYPAFEGTAIANGTAGTVVPRYDLGLFEALTALVLLLFLAVLMQRRPRRGQILGAAGMIYAPVRFLLDFLARRSGTTADPRFLMLTPAQWGFGLVALMSLGMLIWVQQVSGASGEAT